MAWSNKKIKAKMNDFFKNKKIAYTLEEEKDLIFKFEVCLTEAGYILYPYITISADDMVSFNVNISTKPSKNFDYTILNEFNLKSRLFKTFCTNEGIIALEYKFLLTDELIEYIELLVDQLFILQYDIDKL